MALALAPRSLTRAHSAKGTHYYPVHAPLFPQTQARLLSRQDTARIRWNNKAVDAGAGRARRRGAEPPAPAPSPFGKHTGAVLRCSVLQPPGHPWTSWEGNCTRRQRAAALLSYPSLPLVSPRSPPIPSPSLSQPSGQSQSLNLPGLGPACCPHETLPVRAAALHGCRDPWGCTHPFLTRQQGPGLPRWPQHHRLPCTAPNHRGLLRNQRWASSVTVLDSLLGQIMDLGLKR